MNLRLSVLAIVSAAFASTAYAVPIQWAVADGGNDHWYDIDFGNFDWDQADAAARASTHMGLTGHLATITSVGEQRFLNALNPGSTTLWIDGSDGAEEGVFRYTSGPEAGVLMSDLYTNWGAGEPNNNGTTGEDFTLGWWNGGEWNDIFRSFTAGYVVEYSQNPVGVVPLPAGLPLLAVGLGAFGLLRRKRAG